jgi:hypothetical protein
MTFTFWLLLAWFVSADAYWFINLVLIVRMMRAVPVLARLRPADPPRWPKLSLVIPACNEATTLLPAMQSRLRDDYPDLECVLVDDRSNDGSSAIVDEVAAADARVVPLHIADLPDGWLGKVHALHRGAQQARGAWLLFSDADVHFAPGTLRRAIAYCEARGIDHLAILPELWPSGFLVDTALSGFARIFCLSVRPWALENPASTAAVGIGAFNLVRRSAFEQTAGFEWLRLTVVDDMALGQMLKKSGARGALLNGRGMVGLYFYRSLGEMARGAEKSGILALRRFHLPLLTAMTLVLLALETGPFLAPAFAHDRRLCVLGIAGLLPALASVALFARWIRRPILSALCIPIGSLLMSIVTWRSWIVALRRGGVMWRGVLYPARILREKDRFELR